MPHDVNGKILKQGDKVLVRCTVLSVGADGDYCNANLETDLAMPGNGVKTKISAINTRQIEKVNE